jgi:GT2 family glycosyltransferase
MSVQVVIPTRGTPHLETIEVAGEICKNSLPVKYIKQGYSAGDTKSHAVYWFLMYSKADYLLILDDDVIPPPNLLSLADRNVDIVAGLYPILNLKLSKMPFYSAYMRYGNGFIPADDMKTNIGMVERDAVAGGAMCIRREVLQKIKPAFLDLYDEWGRKTTSEDIYFCLKAKEAGYKIYADYDVLCEHIKNVRVTEMINNVVLSMDMWNAINPQGE